MKERPEKIQGRHVIEIGSRDVNGSVEPIFRKYDVASYLGVDISTGKRVDMIWDITKINVLPFEGLFDWVVCTEVLEHVEDWKAAVRNLKWLLKPGGYMLVTTRSEGFPYHDYPGDHWRFSIENIRDIFAEFVEAIIIIDPLELGVFFFGRKPKGIGLETDLSSIEVKEMQPDETVVCPK